MMKTCIPFLLLLACTQLTHVQAQDLFRAKTALSLNVETGIFWNQSRVSFEQEMLYWPEKGISMGFRLSFGHHGTFDPLLGDGRLVPSFAGTIAAYVLTGRKNHHFEAALGPEFFIPPLEFIYPVIPYAEVGYRCQSPSSGFFVRGFAGFIGGLGAGVGYSFPVKNR